MHHETLHPHPTTPATPDSPAVRTLTVGVAWNACLTLHYRFQGTLTQVLVPSAAAPLRTDELWRHTCCELFVAAPAAAWYCELNFSPSGAWAAYFFDSYRSGMRAVEAEPPRIVTHSDSMQLDVEVELQLDSIPALRSIRELQCALSAVVEDQSGARSFWALKHPAGQPDFHHPGSFALRLRMPEAGR